MDQSQKGRLWGGGHGLFSRSLSWGKCHRLWGDRGCCRGMTQERPFWEGGGVMALGSRMGEMAWGQPNTPPTPRSHPTDFIFSLSFRRAFSPGSHGVRSQSTARSSLGKALEATRRGAWLAVRRLGTAAGGRLPRVSTDVPWQGGWQIGTGCSRRCCRLSRFRKATQAAKQGGKHPTASQHQASLPLHIPAHHFLGQKKGLKANQSLSDFVSPPPSSPRHPCA